VRRSFLERVVRRVYGRGFKILLDLVAAARGEVRVAELPYRMRSRQRGESKLGARVIAEFFMLILYHLTGRLLPARFFLFGAVGATGVAVHLGVLTAAFHATGGNFLASQALATWAAMTSNFFLNNAITYGDQRLHGAALWRGLFSFAIACGIGVINLPWPSGSTCSPWRTGSLACRGADRRNVELLHHRVDRAGRRQEALMWAGRSFA
jgi:dolichol-phosphate mannosyltransferase